MRSRERFGVAALALILAVLLLPSGVVTAQPRKGPAVDEIIVETRATGEVAVGDVATGRLDMYMKSLSPTVYEGLPEYMKENLRLVPNAGGSWEITLNPYYEEGTPYLVHVEGKTYFNPFAIRKVRFAMNFLINRKYLVDEVLLGGGEIAYSPISPSHPAYKEFEDIFKEFGFTPEGNEQIGIQMIDEALTEAAEQLGGRLKKVPDPRAPSGYWWTFDGEPVTVKFYIRIEDERHEEGLYVADQIEKAGIKVERIEANFLKCIYTVYFSNPADYQWNLYTAGWGATEATKYVEGDLAWFYTPIFGWMPAYQMAGWWEWQNDTVDMLIQDLIFMNLTSPGEYWEKARQVMRIGVYESIRVFTAITVDFFPVNKNRVTRLAYDAVTGLWSYWPWRTVETVDGKLRVAVEAQQAQMYTSAWNPIGGLDDVYSHVIARATYDEATPSHPTEAEPMPVRVTWDLDIDYAIEEGSKVGQIEVPSTAVIYDSKENKWVEVGPGQKAMVKAVIKYKFSKWHSGIPMDLNDIRYDIAFAYEWAHEDEEGDPYFHPEYASGVAPSLEYFKGFEFIEPDTLVVYGDYLHIVSENETAEFYVWWPVLPWEIYEACAYLIAKGGPVSGNEYSWYKEEGKEYLDLISPAHVEDLRAAIEQLRLEGHVPDPLAGRVTPTQAVERYNAALRFTDLYGHAWISNGPFVLVTYDPQRMYMRLLAFRDESYPFTEDYWINKFMVIRERVESIQAPVTVTAGESFDVIANVIESQEYPEVLEYPAEEAYVAVRLKDAAGNTIYETEMSLVTAGQFKATIPGSATEGLPEGSYTIEVLAGKTSGLITGTSSVEIVLTVPTPPPTTEAPTTTPPPTTAPPTTTPPPPTTTPPPPGPNWALIGGVIVVIIIVVAAILLLRKKSE